MIRVAGLDISTTRTGLAVIDIPTSGVDGFDVPAIQLGRVNSSAPAARLRRVTVGQRGGRMRAAAEDICQFLGRGDRIPDLAVHEAPAYSAGSMAGQFDLAGLKWAVMNALDIAGVPQIEVVTGKIKKYATGSGATAGANKVEKGDVMAAVIRRYGTDDLRIRDDNEADALVLAAIGARLLGYPIEEKPLPAANAAACNDLVLPPTEEGTRR